MNKIDVLLEIEDEKYGMVKLALNEEYKEVCIINGKIITDEEKIYEIKLRNHLCRRKEEWNYIE